jgi:hypothetical protein
MTFFWVSVSMKFQQRTLKIRVIIKLAEGNKCRSRMEATIVLKQGKLALIGSEVPM